MNSPRPVALITGASAGIGATFARQLAARGYDLILVARRENRLRELAAALSTSVEALPADLNVPADRARLASRIASEPRLDLLVNNAGFGTLGRLWETDLAGQQRMHQVHVMATLELTQAALKGMVTRGRGGVINVASVAAFACSPGNVSYCATKAWMASFTEGLAAELRTASSPVKVQALCPGFTLSEFHDAMGFSRDLIPRPFWMRADDVVRASLEGLDRGKIIVIPGWRYKVFVSVFRRLPISWRMGIQARSPQSKGRY